MKINDFKEWLKKQPEAEKIPIEMGMLNGNKEQFISLAPTSNVSDIQAIGAPSSYNVIGITLRLRYGTNFTTAQSKAKELQSLFEKTEKTDMNGVFVYFMTNDTQPVYNGKDRKGVFEFTLKVKVYYERKS